MKQYTHTVQPYAYGKEKHTIRVWYVPYAYGMKYAYGTQQLDSIGIDNRGRVAALDHMSLYSIDAPGDISIRENKIVKKLKMRHSRNLSTSKITNYRVRFRIDSIPVYYLWFSSLHGCLSIRDDKRPLTECALIISNR